MAFFQQIQTEFARLGHNKQSKLSQSQLNKALDKISELNCNVPSFDRHIAEQLWEHSNKSVQEKALLKDYIQTIIDAKNILTENIEKCKKHLLLPQTKNKQQLQECIFSYGEDLRIINKTFKFQGISLGPVSASGQRQSNLNSRIFSDQISPHQQSLSLRFALYLVVLLLFCELFCMFVRHHFINLLAYLAVLSIYFLNYFDSTYIKVVLITIFVAVLSDICWFALHSRHFLSPSETKLYSHLQDGVLRLIVIVVVCGTIGKALLFVLLFRFRSNMTTTRKMVNICGNKIQLGSSSEKNPLTRLIEGKKDQY